MRLRQKRFRLLQPRFSVDKLFLHLQQIYFPVFLWRHTGFTLEKPAKVAAVTITHFFAYCVKGDLLLMKKHFYLIDTVNVSVFGGRNSCITAENPLVIANADIAAFGDFSYCFCTVADILKIFYAVFYQPCVRGVFLFNTAV